MEKQEYNKNLLQGDKVDEWDNLVQLVGVNVNSALSKSTNDQYNFWWKKFLEFCAKFEREPSPFCVLTAVAFFSWLAEQSNGVGGVDQARAALKHYHNKNFPGLSCPMDNVQVSSVLKGIKRRFAKPVEKKKPLAPQDFSKLLSFIVGEDLSLLKMVDLRFAAQVSLMYCTFSRFEESVGLHVHHVVEEDGSFLVNFPKGKQYQFGEARTSVMLSQPQLPINPVVVLKHYLARLGTFSEAKWLFPTLKCVGKNVVVVDKPVSYDCALKQFKHFAKEAGISGCPGDYGFH